MRFIAALLIGIVLPGAASAQTREETIAQTSVRIAQMQRRFAVDWQAAASDTAAATAVNLALTQVLALRDSLAGNPYVRVSSFSVGIPAGISVELTFPPAE